MMWSLLLLSACRTDAEPDASGPDALSSAELTGATGATAVVDSSAPTGDSGDPPGPAVVLVIGDGMGPTHMEAASYFAHGASGQLAIDALAVQGSMRTASLSGITDSAAAGTVFACGVHTTNARIGQDERGGDLSCLFELAKAQGWATGVVTTARLPHATPATFTAHHPDRDEELIIAAEQVGAADLMLGGGWAYVEGSDVPDSLRDDDGLLDEMEAAGVSWVRDFETLDQVDLPLMGAFAPAHLPYVADRAEGAPSLTDMVEVALEKLGSDPDGMLLVVEGARIDHAGHGNDMDRMVGEVIELDETVARLDAWLAPRDGRMVVTADHGTGGLVDVVGGSKGTMPTGRWRWNNHSNVDVRVAARGPGSERLAHDDQDGRALHAWIAEAIDGTARDVLPTLVPDGVLDDLGLQLASQLATSSVGDDLGRLETLRVDADGQALAIGIDGVFPWVTHAVVVLLDLDPGAGTGHGALQGQLTDVRSPAEEFLTTLRVSLPADQGLGVDVAVVSLGGVETPYLQPLRGARGLAPPWGDPTSFGRLDVALNYAVPTRTTVSAPLSLVARRGFEVRLPWTSLWPDLAGGVPPDTEIGVAALLVQMDGQATNQALPSWPVGTLAPEGPVALTAMAIIGVDPDGDGVAGPPELR